MADLNKGRYEQNPEFESDVNEPLVEISSLTGNNKELWLIQWPVHQTVSSDIDGKEITIRLNKDGNIGSFETSTGKTYDLVSHDAQKPDASVIIASGSGSKVVGKISRRVCLVHYSEPSEYKKVTSRRSVTSYRSGGSQMTGMTRTPMSSSKNRSSTLIQGFSHENITTPDKSTESNKHKRVKNTEQTSKSTGLGSEGSMPNSNISMESDVRKKKKKIKVEE
ncbi:hypothetical protein ZOSMA_199G00290 [Zostera marina]|uniref:Mediator-associated protein 2 n=1 Tax=Zostera marina TaxID=29655 RepID=A0A0K9PQU5_ZOSMR|nr:hypothetical protein ZOSMA_199G00290 [Zostera marina]